MGKLVKFDFPTEDIKINNLYKDEEILAEIRKTTPDKCTIPKIEAAFGELLFPEAPEDRPYTFCSVVLSSDGKMAYPDKQAGPLIAKNNYFDSNGALADYWMLNALRVYSDGVIIGAGTLQREPDSTSHVFDKQMAKERIEVLGKSPCPVNIVVSFDGTDIPFEHKMWDIDESESYQAAIATSPDGGTFIKDNFKKEHVVFGPYSSKDEVDIEGLKNSIERNIEIPIILTGSGNRPDTNLLMWILRKVGMERLLIESPSYNWFLMQNGQLDEYFINYSMVYAGGTITPGFNAPYDHDNHPHAKLVSLGIHKSSFMYTRQKLYYGITADEDLSKYEY